MRQLIARIEEDLHRRLKERAAAEGRTLNALVTEALEAAAAPRSARERARVAGLLEEPATPERSPSMEEVVACTRGAGAVFAESLEEVRPTEVFRRAVELVGDYALRALDALHLAVTDGLTLAGDEPLVFVTRDVEQSAAAKACGLMVG